MTLENYFELRLKKYQSQYSRMGAATLANEEGDIIVDRNTDIEGLQMDGYQLSIDLEKIPAHIKETYERGVLNVGLFEGRHNLPVEEYIFKGEFDPADIRGIDNAAGKYFGHLRHVGASYHTVNLYITGLTSGTIAALTSAMYTYPNADIVCWHYNMDTGEYMPQVAQAFESSVIL